MAILHLNFRSDSIMRSVYPVVFLPDFNGWNDRPAPYKTLYFLPGYSGGGLETAQFTNFALYAMKYGIAVVLIDGENSFYVDDETRRAMFSEYAGREIVEATRALLPLSDKREDTYIGGISMGGYGALVNGLRYPQTFSKIAALSPALGVQNPEDKYSDDMPASSGEVTALLGTWEEYENTYKDCFAAALKAAKAPSAMPRLFAACGRQDKLCYANYIDFRDAVRKAGASVTTWECEGGHDHTFWKKALTPACEFLTSEEG